MKILGICGSIAKNSMNRKFLQALSPLAEPHILNIMTLENIPIFSPDLEEQPQVVAELCRAIGDADRIIFASPEYNYSVTGVLKNTLDWISRDQQKAINGKKAAIIGASPGRVGTARGQYHLRQIGVFLNIHFLNKPEVFISECHNKIDSNGEITDQGTKDILQTMIRSLCENS